MAKEKDREIDIAAIEQAICEYSRAPFRTELARLLGCLPDEESIRKFGKKHVDRLYQSVAIVGRLAGFSEKVQVDGSLSFNINQTSDAEKLRLIAEYEAQLKAIDAEVVPAEVKQLSQPENNGERQK
jgi:hypothetical protein